MLAHHGTVLAVYNFKLSFSHVLHVRSPVLFERPGIVVSKGLMYVRLHVVEIHDQCDCLGACSCRAFCARISKEPHYPGNQWRKQVHTAHTCRELTCPVQVQMVGSHSDHSNLTCGTLSFCAAVTPKWKPCIARCGRQYMHPFLEVQGSGKLADR